MVNNNHESQTPLPSENDHSEPAAKVDCRELLALIPAYSIGATDPDETLRVEALLPHCPEAIAELANYLALSDALLFSAPEVTAPQPHTASENHLVSAAPSVQPRRLYQNRLKWYWWANRLAIGAAAAVLIFSNVFWWSHTNDLQAQQRQLMLALAEQEAKYAALGQNPPHHEQLVSTQGDSGSAIVIWETDKQIGTLYAVGLPPLQENHVYQLWIARPGYEISLGVFKVDANGTGTLVFKAAEPILNFEAIGVSVEPGSGSVHPTTPMGILGKIERT